jgi:hypothetical protein
MKRNWTPDELARHFSLSFDEFDLLANKSGPTCLGFAVLLKFFQFEGRFLNAKSEVPRSLVNYLAPQVEVEAEAYLEYDWLGRSIKYHRAQIRQFLGFKPASLQDQAQMTSWLTENLVAEEQRPEVLKVAAYQRWRAQKIEPPTPDQLERLIRSVLHTYEENCFTALYHKLSEATCLHLENLLNLPDAPDDEDAAEVELDLPFEAEIEAETSPPASNLAQKQKRKSSGTAALSSASSSSSPLSPKAPLSFQQLKQPPAGTTLKAVLKEIARLQQLCQVKLPPNLFDELTPRQVAAFRSRVYAESGAELRRHPPARRYPLLAAFCQSRSQEVADNLVESLLQAIHRIGARAERRVDKEIIAEYKRVDGKPNLLYRLAEASLAQPDGSVRAVVYPVVNEQTLREVVVEHQYSGKNYRQKVYTVMRGSYGWRLVSALLNTLQFHSNNAVHQPVIKALELLRQYAEAPSTQKYYPANQNVPLEGLVKGNWLDLVIEPTKRGRRKRVNRLYYEMAVLQSLREKLCSKDIRNLEAQIAKLEKLREQYPKGSLDYKLLTIELDVYGSRLIALRHQLEVLWAAYDNIKLEKQQCEQREREKSPVPNPEEPGQPSPVPNPEEPGQPSPVPNPEEPGQPLQENFKTVENLLKGGRDKIPDWLRGGGFRNNGWPVLPGINWPLVPPVRPKNGGIMIPNPCYATPPYVFS